MMPSIIPIQTTTFPGKSKGGQSFKRSSSLRMYIYFSIIFIVGFFKSKSKYYTNNSIEMALSQKVIYLGFILSATDNISKVVDVVIRFQNERKSRAMEFTLLPR